MNLGELHRREYGRILASVIRTVRDISLAEDALQEAFVAAHRQWALQGSPANPAAWLLVTARHKAIDLIRRQRLADEKLQLMSVSTVADDAGPARDDTLRLIFTCCHPALAPEAQVALTLRTICGLSTEEVARAFLLPVPTLAQRLVRAKTKIRVAKIPYEVPEGPALEERMHAVLATLYLVFNEGYSASEGPSLLRTELCREAKRLARELVELMPETTAPKALLALMLLTDARRNTRFDAEGRIVAWEEQDRSLWDQAQIAEGRELLERALKEGPAGAYAVQAAIAALHASARSPEETDWPQIVRLYDFLLRLQPSPVVELNRAAAIAMAEGFEKGLTLMNQLTLPDYHLLPAARADLLRRLNRRSEAASAYRDALRLVKTAPEREFLERRLAEVTG